MPHATYELDDTDRRIVAALQANGRASWTDMARLAGMSVATVARRAQQLLADGVIRVAALPQAIESGTDAFVVRLGCAPGAQMDAARELAALPEVRFVALVTGDCDIVAELVVPKSAGVHTLLVDGLQRIPGIERSVADLEMHTYKVSYDWSAGLLPPDAPAAAPAGPPHDCVPDHLDDLDRRIIAVLQDDGRASFQAVASAVGVNESTVRRRYESLYRTGCVRIVTLVPAPALGFESEVLFSLSVAPSRVEAVAERLAALPGVRYLGAILGRASLLCEVILPSHKDVYDFTTRTLGGIDGILAWTANVELLTLKRGFVHTPPGPLPTRSHGAGAGAGGVEDRVGGAGGPG